MTSPRPLSLLLLLLLMTLGCPSGAADDRTGDGTLDGLRTAAADAGLAPELFDRAQSAWRCAVDAGEVRQPRGRRILTVIDYSRRSGQRRLWVLDLEQGELLFSELVAHGKNTGADRARHFSNREGSNQSSLGLFRTAETYRGKHGYSLRLDGLEPGINDAARDRAIVMHGADYATDSFVAKHGRLGRSWGCPALDPAISADVIDTIAGGTLLFAWHPDGDWQEESRFLDCD
jgi:hypothetical protein